MADKKLPVARTPVGIAGYSYTAEPDTKGKYADGKYKVSILFPKEGADNQDEINAFVKRVQTAHKKADGKDVDCPIKDGDKQKSDKVNGYWTFRSKSQYPPVLCDASRNVIPQSIPLWSGDVVIVSFQPKPYKTGANSGLTCYLKGIQVLKKGDGGNQNPDELFDDESEKWGETAADGSDTTAGEEEEEATAESDSDF